jgi:formylglycine-generating enzyme
MGEPGDDLPVRDLRVLLSERLGELHGRDKHRAGGNGIAGSGVWGQLDLAGNVIERNLDWHANSYADPCTDCVLLNSASSTRVIRSDNFSGPVSYLLPPNRVYFTPTVRYADIGFRCARTP